MPPAQSPAPAAQYAWEHALSTAMSMETPMEMGAIHAASSSLMLSMQDLSRTALTAASVSYTSRAFARVHSKRVPKASQALRKPVFLVIIIGITEVQEVNGE